MVKLDMDLSGVKIPKKVAGVKVPKKLRKQGKKLIAKANSTEGREVIAAGLAIAGSVLAAKAARSSGAGATRGFAREGFADRAEQWAGRAEQWAERAAATVEAVAERAAAAGERAAERAAAAGEHVAEQAAAGAERVADKARATTAADPATPGEPGIDPDKDPAAQLGEAIATGIGAFQAFMAGVKRPR